MKDIWTATLGKEAVFELTEDINCIPKGIYRLTDRSDGMFLFAIGDKIHFGVDTRCVDKFRPVSPKRAKFSRTPTGAFVERYYELLQFQKTKIPNLSSPYTMCVMDISVAKDFDMEIH
jgi:hypothetical protein